MSSTVSSCKSVTTRPLQQQAFETAYDEDVLYGCVDFNASGVAVLGKLNVFVFGPTAMGSHCVFAVHSGQQFSAFCIMSSFVFIPTFLPVFLELFCMKENFCFVIILFFIPFH